MPLLHGIGVSPGIAIGPTCRMAAPPPEPASAAAADGIAQAARIGPAAAAVAAELEELAAGATGELADILAATALMAADPEVCRRAEQLAEGSSVSAERAIWEAFASYREQLAAAGGYLAERAGDLDGVRDRIVAQLRGVAAPGIPDPGHPFILVARDLTPADTANLDTERILGFVTEGGGPTSHTAILAKSVGVPAIVACHGVTEVHDGTSVVLDGMTGELTVDADERAVRSARERQAASRRRRRLTEASGHTSDGTPVLLLANIGDVAGAERAVAAGAQGVGLFRTEFLFLDRDEPPSFDEQLATYMGILERFPDQKVVIRTLDAGADKPLPFLNAGAEPNPALGVRGIRICDGHREILEEQLAAIAEAGRQTAAKVHVMAPMVATAGEAETFTGLARKAGIEQAGIMVEVPAVALTAPCVVPHVDFVSIGTNDLTQYTYAADRMNSELAHLNDHWQPAVGRLIEMVGRCGLETGVPVGVCGEAASDIAYAAVLIGLGVRSLSMAPGSLAAVDANISALALDDCQAFAQLAVQAPNADTARELVLEHLKTRVEVL